MDIRSWLAGTKLPALRKESELHDSRSRLPSAQPRPSLRISSSSSFSSIRPAENTHRLREKPRRSREQPPSKRDAASVISSDLGSSFSEQTLRVEERYRRRPRRKPRPDLYETRCNRSQPRERSRKQREARGKGKRNNPARRKKRGKGGGKPASSFHAGNISRDRLTLKPASQPGIFKNGRASSPKRGRGLPDLTFSEMKFLQKRRERHEQESSEEPSRFTRYRKRPHDDNAEISEFFATKHPLLQERNPEVKTAAHRASHRSKRARIDARSTALATQDREMARAPVELPEKPYLGFGSRGAPLTETSHFTWSESTPRSFFQECLPTSSPSIIPHVSKNENGANSQVGSEDQPTAVTSDLQPRSRKRYQKNDTHPVNIISASIQHSLTDETATNTTSSLPEKPLFPYSFIQTKSAKRPEQPPLSESYCTGQRGPYVQGLGFSPDGIAEREEAGGLKDSDRITSRAVLDPYSSPAEKMWRNGGSRFEQEDQVCQGERARTLVSDGSYLIPEPHPQLPRTEPDKVGKVIHATGSRLRPNPVGFVKRPDLYFECLSYHKDMHVEQTQEDVTDVPTSSYYAYGDTGLHVPTKGGNQVRFQPHEISVTSNESHLLDASIQSGYSRWPVQGLEGNLAQSGEGDVPSDFWRRNRLY